MNFPGLAALAVLVLAHLFGRRLLGRVHGHRDAWLSAGGGVAVAYVFVHLLPNLAHHQETLHQAVGDGSLAFLESHAYLLALVGLILFYGLEHYVRASSQGQRQRQDDGEGDGVFWLQISVFALYNLVIGYLVLHRHEPGAENLVFFTLAMALHFVVNDHALAEDHGDLYSRRGRWLLTAAIVIGCVGGEWMPIADAGAASLLALVAGATILNVMKEELPEHRRSRFWAFALGAGGYAALLLLA